MKLLKVALSLDLFTTMLFALAQIFLSPLLAAHTSIPEAFLFRSGLVMLVFSATLIYILSMPTNYAKLVNGLILGNMGWALGCVLAFVFLHESLTPVGQAFIAMHLSGVCFFSFLEYKGLHAIRIQA